MVERNLSNFAHNEFVFDGVVCVCLEGPLQAFKCEDQAQQKIICGLLGGTAKRSGKAYDSWKKDQYLYWKGKRYHRSSQEYQELLDRLYRAAAPGLRDALIKSGNERLVHTIGGHDARETVLTVSELICRLYELRDLLRA